MQVDGVQLELLTKKYFPKEQSYHVTLNLMWTNLSTEDFACLRDYNHFIALIPKSDIHKADSGKYFDWYRTYSQRSSIR